MKYKTGMIVKGKVAGIQPYGVFVTLDNQTQGLIHISELQHGFVENIKESFRVNEEVEVMVLDVDEYTKQISLSLRTLMDSPPQKKQYTRGKKKRYGKKRTIGFQSLEQKMPGWIEEALQKEEAKG